MSRAVLRKEKDGRITYIGHVPPEYHLKPNEYYGKLPGEDQGSYVK